MVLKLCKYSLVIFIITLSLNLGIVLSNKERLRKIPSDLNHITHHKKVKLEESDEMITNKDKEDKIINSDSELLIKQTIPKSITKITSKSKPKSILSTQENDNLLFNDADSTDPMYTCFYPTRYLRLECSSRNYILQPEFDDEDESNYLEYSISLNGNKYISIINEEKGKISINQTAVQTLSFIQITCSYKENEVNKTILEELNTNTNSTTFNLLIEILYNTIPTDIFPLVIPPYFVSDKITDSSLIYGVFFPFTIPNIPLTIIQTLNNSTNYISDIIQTTMIVDQSKYKENYGIADFTSKILLRSINEPETDFSIITFTVNTYTIKRQYSYLIYNNLTSNNNNNNNITYVNQYNITLIFNFISLLNISDSEFIYYFESEIYNRYFKQFILDNNNNNNTIVNSSFGSNNNINNSYPIYIMKFDISIIPIIKNENVNNNTSRILQDEEIFIKQQPIFQLQTIIQSIQSNLTLKNKNNLIFLNTFHSDYKVTEIQINLNIEDIEDEQTEPEIVKTPPNSKKVNVAAIVIPIVLVIIIIIVIIVIYIIWYYYYKSNNKEDKDLNLFGFSNMFERHKSSKISGDYDPYIKDKVLHEGYLWKEGRNRIAYKFQVYF